MSKCQTKYDIDYLSVARDNDEWTNGAHFLILHFYFYSEQKENLPRYIKKLTSILNQLSSVQANLGKSLFELLKNLF